MLFCIPAPSRRPAQVMLMTVQPPAGDDTHLSKCIKFVVGKKVPSGAVSASASTVLALGGPWNRELDGENPEDDATLVRTAMSDIIVMCDAGLWGVRSCSSVKPVIAKREIQHV